MKDLDERGGGTAFLNPPTGSLSNLDIDIASGEGGVLSEGNLFERKRKIFLMLKENPDLMNGNSILQDFYVAIQTSTIGQLEQVKESIQNAVSFSEADNQQLGSLEEGMDLTFSELEEALSLLAQNPDDENLRNQVNSLNASLNNYSTDLGVILDDVSTDGAQYLTTASAENSLITPQTTPGFNEQALNSIYLEVVLKKERDLTENDKAVIANIANQCYSKAGTSVFWARAWHKFITGQTINISDCSIESKLANSNETEDIGISLIVEPNPNSGLMTIKLDELPIGNYAIVVSDIVGKKLREIPLEKGQMILPVNIQGYPSGIYLLSLKDDKSILATEKLVIK